jgi:NAD(P)-dependent dehydrogenase (short-subunit alcohol dehydrogenase family)
MNPLSGRRVIVTGAAGTLGRLLCDRFSADGARVIGLDLRSGAVNGVPVKGCDLTDHAAAAAAVAESVTQLGGLDLLINNAGVGGPAPAEHAPGAAARAQIEVNLMAAWNTTAAAIPALETARGRVIFVASRMAVLPLPLAAAYGVSKRALVAYADTLRLEVGTHIGVTVVYPSMVASPNHDASAQAGLSLDGVSRYEPAAGVIDAIVRCATSAKPLRDVATTRRGRIEMAVARHFPAVATALVRRTIKGRLAAGELDGAPLAAGMVRRQSEASRPTR